MNPVPQTPNPSPAFDLACLGILVLDVFGKPIDVFPEKGASAYFDTLEINPGGCAYNTGVDAARLGLNVAVLGKLGVDNFGDIMAEALRRERVDTRAIVRSAGSQTAFSFQPEWQRCLTGYRTTEHQNPARVQENQHKRRRQ